MRVIMTPTSLGCLGIKWNNLCKVSKTLSLDNLMPARDDCPDPVWGLLAPRLALLPCSLQPNSAPFLLTPHYWLKIHTDLTVSSALPRPTFILDDFKSTWILSLSFFNLHFLIIFTQCFTGASFHQLVKCVHFFPTPHSVTSTPLSWNQPWWEYLHHGNWQMQKTGHFSVWGGSFLEHTISLHFNNLMPWPCLDSFHH